jgi:hypothetical protein
MNKTPLYQGSEIAAYERKDWMGGLGVKSPEMS